MAQEKKTNPPKFKLLHTVYNLQDAFRVYNEVTFR